MRKGPRMYCAAFSRSWSAPVDGLQNSDAMPKGAHSSVL
eukprot:CAMPEP_0175860158 /NCGR_PEP_ID=MMETSP0107_2-20121207/30664_1 /TAXON_ID=195067 ORGANISM="Goniomonas pacifica, Strain CCMP1869" /NCGR_SAMPLE_ID=MMETSP0107_2 /ASSEMBLY_ACC=CAM_ASM_000203 /LENGTH=38 /DNA_ID= /DNA_START= /DNA_END= /DNA_ORIENTATION=